MLKKSVHYVRSWYGRYERPISSISLVGGFVFDAVALRRIDTFWENVWIVVHLLVVAVFIVLINVRERGMGDEANPTKEHFWYVNILQFFFGGLLSAYLVFYFRSSDIAASWPFLLILAIAFWANESLKRQYARLTFQLALFFLSLFSFAIFIVPILVHSVGPLVFLLSGAISLVTMLGFLYIMKYFSRGKIRMRMRAVVLSVAAVFISMNVLYFAHLIPPIPLSLKDAGAYYSIRKTTSGYSVEYENLGWKKYFTLYPAIHPNIEEVYAYSAVFSPTSLNTSVIHVWERYDESTEKWIEEGRVLLPITGGREGGYRTFSRRSALEPGHWRVKVETAGGATIGRIRFTVAIGLPEKATKVIE